MLIESHTLILLSSFLWAKSDVNVQEMKKKGKYDDLVVGDTPIHCAVWHEPNRLVEKILIFQPNVFLCNKEHETTLDVATIFLQNQENQTAYDVATMFQLLLKQQFHHRCQ
jgi:hypothetical protein